MNCEKAIILIKKIMELDQQFNSLRFRLLKRWTLSLNKRKEKVLSERRRYERQLRNLVSMGSC